MAEGGPPWEKIVPVIILAFVTYFLLSSLRTHLPEHTIDSVLADIPVHPRLQQQTKELSKPEIIKVSKWKKNLTYCLRCVADQKFA